VLVAYQEAMKGAFDAANSAAEFTATVAAAAITAYGALIGLVQPQSTAAPVHVAWPFVPFGAALVAAVTSRLISVPIKIENDLNNITSSLKSHIWWKRFIAILAAVAVFAGVVVAGWIVASTYPVAAVSTPSPTPSR
jgi:hypothetical protein